MKRDNLLLLASVVQFALVSLAMRVDLGLKERGVLANTQK